MISFSVAVEGYNLTTNFKIRQAYSPKRMTMAAAVMRMVWALLRMLESEPGLSQCRGFAHGRQYVDIFFLSLV